MDGDRQPRVFMSYSWDGQDHEAWVLQLATRLRTDGVDVVLDRWDTSLGSDLALFMEQAGDENYRVLAIVSSRYTEKANEAKGGVGYERRMITPGIMRDLRGHRVVPVLRDSPEGSLPRFMGSARFIDFRKDRDYEERYFELLQDLYGIEPTPKPPLGRNPFTAMSNEEVQAALGHGPARYVLPALEGRVEAFNYSNNDGRYVIGAGDRAFTLDFSECGHASIYVMSDPPDIQSVALAPGVTSPSEVGDASTYDASSRHRTIRVGDAAVLRNRHNYWAAVFVDEVLTRESSPERGQSITFRFFIPPVPTPKFDPVEASSQEDASPS